jgi:molybdopterin synthase sulfur carrier subunit
MPEASPSAGVMIQIPDALRPFAGGGSALSVAADTVGAALVALETRHPGLRARLREEGGGLRESVLVLLNGEDIRSLAGEDTPVRSGDKVAIVPAIAGG